VYASRYTRDEFLTAWVWMRENLWWIRGIAHLESADCDVFLIAKAESNYEEHGGTATVQETRA
jgi:hypothetical protein